MRIATLATLLLACGGEESTASSTAGPFFTECECTDGVLLVMCGGDVDRLTDDELVARAGGRSVALSCTRHEKPCNPNNWEACAICGKPSWESCADESESESESEPDPASESESESESASESACVEDGDPCDYCWSPEECDPAYDGDGEGCDCGCDFSDSDCPTD